MKKLFNNQKGSMSVSIIYITLIIIIILISLIYKLTNNIVAVNSNNDSYRANYISESITELKIMEITELYHETISEYLMDLKRYKIEYIKAASIDPYINYNPPNFSTYIQRSIPHIKKLSSDGINTFKEYEDDHYYKIEIDYDSSKKVINITSMGRYNRARRFIKVKLEIPKVIDCGLDEYNLPKVGILSVNIVEYYHTIGL